MTGYREFPVPTQHRNHWVDVTSQVSDAIADIGARNGICLVSTAHTSAAVTINENSDPAVARDVFATLSRLIPTRDDYEHAEGNSDAHVKAMLTGLSVQVPIHNGRLVLGTWQAVYLCEFDGPRKRTVAVTVVGD